MDKPAMKPEEKNAPEAENRKINPLVYVAKGYENPNGVSGTPREGSGGKRTALVIIFLILMLAAAYFAAAKLFPGRFPTFGLAIF